MITDVPQASALKQAGLDYLCLAWGDLIYAINSAEGYAELQSAVEDSEEDLVKLHWERQSRRLAICASLIHQGVELLLKSRIAEVSPYLLLDSISTWPGTVGQDVDFGSLKTVDAQLLPRLHDSVCRDRLDDQFRQRFETMRRRRNAVTHGLGAHVFTAEELLRDVLESVACLIGDGSWPSIRRDYENSEPAPWADYHGLGQVGLMREWEGLINLLKPAECERYLAFDKKQQ